MFLRRVQCDGVHPVFQVEAEVLPDDLDEAPVLQGGGLRRAGQIGAQLCEEIIDKLIEDIFNATVANW